MKMTALSEAKVGSEGVVTLVDLPEEVSHHLAHLWLSAGVSIEVLRFALRRAIRVSTASMGLKLGCGTRPPNTSFLKLNRTRGRMSCHTPTAVLDPVGAVPDSSHASYRPQAVSHRGSDRAAELRQVDPLQPADRAAE